MLLLPADSTILVCTRAPLVYDEVRSNHGGKNLLLNVERE